jgi:hypothetical protein
MHRENLIFIAWLKYHRRTKELGKELGAKVYFFGNEWIRDLKILKPFYYFITFLRSFFILTKEKPEIVLAQSPPTFCPLVACIYALIFKKKYIIDAHNFTFSKFWLSIPFSKFVFNSALVVLVHNDVSLGKVKSLGMNFYVLEDKLPDLSWGKQAELNTKKNILVVRGIHRKDQDRFLNIALYKCIPEMKDFTFYITGYAKYVKNEIGQLYSNLPDNLILTNFLSETNYNCLLRSVDLVIVLVGENDVQPCGAVEAVAANKPLVISDTRTTRRLFEGAVFVNNEPKDIMEGIRSAFRDRAAIERRIKLLSTQKQTEWDEVFNDFVSEFIA